jgi:hypothetical protein
VPSYDELLENSLKKHGIKVKNGYLLISKIMERRLKKKQKKTHLLSCEIYHVD